LVSYTATAYYVRGFWRHNPSSFAAGSLLAVLESVHRFANYWPVLSFKRDLIRLLETAAISARDYVPRRLSSGDWPTKEWLREEGRQVAAALRGKKRLILSADPDVQAAFVAGVASAFVSIAKGDWHAVLESGPSDAEPLPDRRRPPRWYTLVTFSIAAVPGFFLLLFAYLPWIDVGIPRAVIDVAAVWAVATVVFRSADPHIAEKVATLQEIVRFVRGGV
jgi:hypothetical protein